LTRLQYRGRGAKKSHARFQFLASVNIHSCVAFLPCARLVLKTLKPKELDVAPVTLGEHIKRRRLELELTQPQAAERLGVNPTTVVCWEKGKGGPSIRSFPAIFAFLSHSPYPEPATVCERLHQWRRERGRSICEAALQLGVDPTTWGDWERGKLILFRKHRMAVAQLLGLNEPELDSEMGARWNMKHPR
jgi:transcriptional regulator with XRE-family HTH domain